MADKSSTRVVTNGEFVSLKEHFEMRFNALDKALELAQKTNDIRLAGMNEFRDAMNDQSGKFITRIEADAHREKSVAEIRLELSSICAEVKILNAYMNNEQGKATQSSVYIAYIVAAIGIILSVVGILLAL